MKKSFPTLFLRLSSLFIFGLLLCFPADTLAGASTGLLLWFQTVLPTLLPAMILADFLLQIGADQYLTKLLAKPCAWLFRLSPAGCYGLLIGFLCGYPMGAKTAASLLKEKRISHSEASYLLAFTNQPSPMFLIGYLCLGLLHSMILPVLLGVYGSALMINICYRACRQLNRHRYHSMTKSELSHPTHPKSHRQEIHPSALHPDTHKKSANLSPLSLLELSMMTSFEVMVKIGGYMMLFSIGEIFIAKLTVLPETTKVLLMGFVEMTTGCQHIARTLSPPWAAAACGGLAAFGGLSGFAQTANVLQDSGLSSGRYFLWKLLQGLLAGSLILLFCFWAKQYPPL